MHRGYTSVFLLAFLLGASAPLLLAACGDKDPPPCVECGAYGGGAVRCFTGFTSQIICAPDQSLAAITCSEYGGTWSPATLCPVEPAETGSDGPGAAPFEPSRDVTFDHASGEYVINRIAFEELKLDPAPLFGDATKLREHELGHEVAAAGELSRALGWQVGDVLLDLDGHPLRNLAEFSVAYTALAEVSNFELTIRRGDSNIVVKYRVE
jgi:hypothetical protein